jgi:hypothetical protein
MLRNFIAPGCPTSDFLDLGGHFLSPNLRLFSPKATFSTPTRQSTHREAETPIHQAVAVSKALLAVPLAVRPLAPIQCAEAQTSTLAKLDKLGHQLLNFRTGTSLGGRQLFFCSHPDSSTQAPLVEQVCWSDAYAERQHSGKCYDGGLNCLVLRVSLHSCPESVPLRFLLSYSR